MSSTSTSHGVVVHTSPPLAPLPASDVESIRVLANLRAAGVKPAVTTEGWTANGKPFVTDNDAPVSAANFPSLSSYRSADTELTSAQRADVLSWSAYIDGQVTDLIYHSLYSLPPNYPYLAGAQVAALPFPQTHYVPQRLRGIHRQRLESVGLWGLGGVHAGDAVDEDRKRLEDSFVVAPGGTKTERKWSGWNAGREAAERSRTFGEEKIRVRAQTAFQPIARKLGSDKFFFGRRPTTLDIALFSNLTLVLSPDLPNPLLANLLRSEFPSLVAHHDAVLAALYPQGWASVPRITPPAAPALSTSLWSYLPSWAGGAQKKKPEVAEPEAGDEMLEDQARRLSIGRWMWFAGAGAAFITYLLTSGLLSVSYGDEDEDEEVWIEVGEDDDDEKEGLLVSGFEGDM